MTGPANVDWLISRAFSLLVGRGMWIWSQVSGHPKEPRWPIQQCRVLFAKNMCSPYANFLVSKGVKKSPPKEQKNVDISQNKCTYNPLWREFCPVVLLPGCTLGVCLTHINLQKLKKHSPYKILSLVRKQHQRTSSGNVSQNPSSKESGDKSLDSCVCNILVPDSRLLLFIIKGRNNP